MTEKQKLRVDIEGDIVETARISGKSIDEVRKLLSGECALTHSEIRSGLSFEEMINKKRLNKSKELISGTQDFIVEWDNGKQKSKFSNQNDAITFQNHLVNGTLHKDIPKDYSARII